MRCDNAGKNKTTEKLANSAQWKLSIQLEHTARNTPQQNSPVETGFARVLNKSKTLLIDSNVPYLLRYKIFQEAVLTATKLDGLVTATINNGHKTRYELFGMRNSSFVNHLRTWGEAEVIKISTKTTPKLKNKGVTCAFVGHVDSHAADCYRMWDPEGHYIYVTRGVIWLKRMYFPKSEENEHDAHKAIEVPVSTAGERESDATAENNQNANENQTTVPSEPSTNTRVPPSVPSRLKVTIGNATFMPSENNANENENEDNGEWEETPAELPFKEVKRSSTGRTTHPRKFYQDEHQGVCADTNYYSVLHDDNEEDENDDYYEHAMLNVGAGIGGGCKHSSELKVLKYKQAMASKDKNKWKNEIKKEHKRMLKHDVWEPVPKEDVPDVQPLTSTWAFKMKSNGNLRGRLNAHGFKKKRNAF